MRLLPIEASGTATHRRRRTAAAQSTILLLSTSAGGQTIDEHAVDVPEQAVTVEPIARDEAIQGRINRILEATGWYRGVEVVADEIGRTQALIAEVLREHDATLDEPPPMVLVDVRGSATVNLKAHFWIDGRTISPQRIRSSALRVIKRSLVEHGVSMPDEAREIIFPQGVPLVRMKPDGTEPDEMSVALTASAAGGPPPSAAEPNLEATSAEGGLGNEMT